MSNPSSDDRQGRKERILHQVALPYRVAQSSRGYTHYQLIPIWRMIVLPLEVYELRFTLAASQGQYPHSLYCPMCRLLALKQASARGVNPPRPFVIRPPLAARPEDECLYLIDEHFEIGINLFGDAVHLFPYVCEALQCTAETGMGFGRGRFALLGIHEHNRLSAAVDALLENRQVRRPQHPMTAA